MLANSARPSPWATAKGNLEPAIPERNIEFDTSTLTKLNLPSNCSDRLRTKRGHCSAPGINSRNKDTIWQPLQTPSVKVSARSKKSEN